MRNLRKPESREQKKRPFRKLAVAALLTAGCTEVSNEPYLYRPEDVAGPGQCFVNERRVLECETISSDNVRIGDTLAVGDMGFKVISVDDVDDTKAVRVHAMRKDDVNCTVLNSGRIKPGETTVLAIDNQPYQVEIVDPLYYDGAGPSITMRVVPNCD